MLDRAEFASATAKDAGGGSGGLPKRRMPTQPPQGGRRGDTCDADHRGTNEGEEEAMFTTCTLRLSPVSARVAVGPAMRNPQRDVTLAAAAGGEKGAGFAGSELA